MSCDLRRNFKKKGRETNVAVISHHSWANTIWWWFHNFLILFFTSVKWKMPFCNYKVLVRYGWKKYVSKLPVNQHPKSVFLWTIPWDESCETISFCSLIELRSTMLENIKQVSLPQLLWTFNGLTCRVSFQERHTVFSQTYWAMEHCSQSTWRDLCLQNPPWETQCIGYSDTHLTKLGGLGVVTCAKFPAGLVISDH